MVLLQMPDTSPIRVDQSLKELNLATPITFDHDKSYAFQDKPTKTVSDKDDWTVNGLEAY